MMAPNNKVPWLEAGMAAFWRAIEERPEASSAFEESEREFHGSEVPEGNEVVLSAARRRRLEWFLFERHEDGSLLAETLSVNLGQLAGEELAARAELFLESWTGIFSVLAAPCEGEFEARDLGGLATLRLAIPAGGPTLATGDLVVGRLFPSGNGSYIVSPAAGLFRSPALVEALERDLQRLRQEGAHAVVRLTQLELERMFFAPGSAAETEMGKLGAEQASDPEREFEQYLLGAGVSPEVVASWLELLHASPRRPEELISGLGDAMGAILDQLAFQTNLDLDRARALMLATWPGADTPSESTDASGEQTRGESNPVVDSLREFDRDRAAGLDLEASFSELEKRLGLHPEKGEEDQGAPDFPGVVGAMVEEYLWETERDEGLDLRRAREGLRVFGAYTERLGVFENLTAREFLSFAAFWLPESRMLRSGTEAARMVDSLLSFGMWAAEFQGLDSLGSALQDQLSTLVRSLPRVVEANALLPREPQIEDGELFEFLGPTNPGQASVRDLQGEEREVPFEARLIAVLECGDLFRGHTSQADDFVVSCCYPPEAAGLRQTLN
jgi:hypothetical protein